MAPCEDRLSNLLGYVKEMIVGALSMREAFRTSVLSTEWQYTARVISQLIFDMQPSWSEYRYMTMVDHVLSTHSDAITKFMVSGDIRDDNGVVDRWVRRVSDLSVKELTIRMTHGLEDMFHRISERLYSNHHLTCLHLTSCSLGQPPSSFTGFIHLKKIVLYRVRLDQISAHLIFGNCQSLKVLSLCRITGYSVFCINAPALQNLMVSSSVVDISLVNSKRLSQVHIQESDGLPATMVYGQGNLQRFFSVLPRVEVLTIRGLFMKWLASRYMPRLMLLSQLA